MNRWWFKSFIRGCFLVALIAFLNLSSIWRDVFMIKFQSSLTAIGFGDRHQSLAGKQQTFKSLIFNGLLRIIYVLIHWLNEVMLEFIHVNEVLEGLKKVTLVDEGSKSRIREVEGLGLRRFRQVVLILSDYLYIHDASVVFIISEFHRLTQYLMD